tara:strand:- start:486 stop:1202 length:717 start_codon:yes stop_codon:yes gene_type:complete
MSKLTVYIGFDSNTLGQRKAFEVCKRSIKDYNPDINIEPILLERLIKDNIYKRPHDPKQSTDFTYTRFLVPYLNKFKNYALFCDSDFVFKCDVKELLDFISLDSSIACVKHEYKQCNDKIKMDGKTQEWYPRKNWSSLMLFNCEDVDCKGLTPDVINTQTPKFLHRMEWTSDNKISEIPLEYNYLVGYYDKKIKPKAIHFTDGGPWHEDYQTVDFYEEWISYLNSDELKQYKQKLFWK